MTITTATGQKTFTEADLLGLSVRFEIRSERGVRRFYVDGKPVTESEYRRQFEADTASQRAS